MQHAQSCTKMILTDYYWHTQSLFLFLVVAIEDVQPKRGTGPEFERRVSVWRFTCGTMMKIYLANPKVIVDVDGNTFIL